MRAESGIEDELTMSQDVSGPAVMDHGRRHQAKTGVVVLVVVLLEEGLAEAASVLSTAAADQGNLPVSHVVAGALTVASGCLRTF
jgi:hypothetical protein